MAEPENTEQRPQQHPDYEEKGAVMEVLMQTAQDLKEVGLTVAAGYGLHQMTKPKDPPKDK